MKTQPKTNPQPLTKEQRKIKRLESRIKSYVEYQDFLNKYIATQKSCTDLLKERIDSLKNTITLHIKIQEQYVFQINYYSKKAEHEDIASRTYEKILDKLSNGESIAQSLSLMTSLN